jgi:hypothetical protein
MSHYGSNFITVIVSCVHTLNAGLTGYIERSNTTSLVFDQGAVVGLR